MLETALERRMHDILVSTEHIYISLKEACKIVGCCISTLKGNYLVVSDSYMDGMIRCKGDENSYKCVLSDVLKICRPSYVRKNKREQEPIKIVI